MTMLSTRVAMVCITFMTLSLIFSATLTLAEGQKPKATPQSKVITPKAKLKVRTVEPAAKTEACFGVAPQIEKLIPDEGQPGAKVTITGTEFGSPGCLRGVSFGPGQSAAFSMGSESTIVATVPTSNRKGLVIVTVTTASGEDSKPFLIK